MKKSNFILFFLLVLLFPINSFAKNISYTTSNFSFSFDLDENEWAEISVTEINSYFDKKWENSKGFLSVGVYDQIYYIDDSSLNNSYNYSNRNSFEERSEDIIITLWGQYNVNDWNYVTYDDKYVHAYGNFDENNLNINKEFYFTFNKSYLIIFMFESKFETITEESSLFLENIVKNIEFKNEKVQINDTIIVTIILCLLYFLCYCAYPFFEIKLFGKRYNSKNLNRLLILNSLFWCLLFSVVTFHSGFVIFVIFSIVLFFINKLFWKTKINKECSVCGNILNNEDVFCFYCGNRIR